ncbi:MAG: NADH:ubiquinone reductase (Na(+)-transporting) subunit D [Myxococcus sp.]|nr:NADH:ubiquinone reductase (Na(+)-transporting) subunit D [Myxococcus sp.]
MSRLTTAFRRPLLEENPVSVQLLGICSALAVTKSLAAALVMGAALTSVLVASNALISLLRNVIPHATRLVLQITIIASLVIVTDQVLAAFAPKMSEQLSIFVSLIITNCIILGRAEAFAMTHGVGESVADGLGNGVGYTLLLAAVGAVRELLTQGAVLGFSLLPLTKDGGWFEPLQILGLPPAGFFLIALFIWLTRLLRQRLVKPAPVASGAAR